jgi:UDP-glucose 4-epimerase
MVLMLRRRQFDARVYNVLTLNTTVADVVKVLESFVPGLAISYVESPLMNTLSYCVDNRRFANLGFEISGSLERGIGDTVAMLSSRSRDVAPFI